MSRSAMSAVLSVRITNDQAFALDRLARATGKRRAVLVREAVRAHLLRQSLRLTHAELAPQALAAGWATEEDVLREPRPLPDELGPGPRPASHRADC
jgi:predicted transcriptional regulator